MRPVRNEPLRLGHPALTDALSSFWSSANLRVCNLYRRSLSGVAAIVGKRFKSSHWEEEEKQR
jgi:hypothetical protein